MIIHCESIAEINPQVRYSAISITSERTVEDGHVLDPPSTQNSDNTEAPAKCRRHSKPSKRSLS